MSISINTKHFNLTEILQKSGLSNITLKNNYRIFGLKPEANKLIKIELNRDSHHAGSNINIYEKITDSIYDFMEANNIKGYFNDNKYGLERIQIGLRKDLRENTLFAALLIKTIILAFEEQLKLNNKYIIKNFPKNLIDK